MNLSPIRAALNLTGRSAWLSAFAMWATFSAVCGLLILPIVIDGVPLGPDFRLAIFASIVGAVSAGLFLTLLFLLANTWVNRRASRQFQANLSRRQRLGVLVFVTVAAIGCATGLWMWIDSKHSRTIADAEAARLHFNVTNYGQDFHQSKTNQTLAEFERARRRLEQEWPRPDTVSPISVHLFRDIEDYHANTGRSLSRGLAWCQPTGAVVAVPLEEAMAFLAENDYTRTPMHETVHAMMCQSLGDRAFYSIPRWFHEGMAETYENEGSYQRVDRALVRFFFWIMSDDDIMYPQVFCGEPLDDPASDMVLFNRIAMEFVRALVGDHDGDTLNELVEDVGNGIAFEDSLYNHFGGTCVELYSDWVKSWQKVLRLKRK